MPKYNVSHIVNTTYYGVEADSPSEAVESVRDPRSLLLEPWDVMYTGDDWLVKDSGERRKNMSTKINQNSGGLKI